MEFFLGNRELVAFSLTSETEVFPDDFKEQKTEETQDWSDWSTTKFGVLPDGTKHGKFKKDAHVAGWRETAGANYKLGKLHGEFYICHQNDFKMECKGEFREGLPCGVFLFSSKFFLTEKKQVFYLRHEDGLPVHFEKDQVKFDIIWDNNTVDINGEKYTNLFCSEEYPETIGDCPFSKYARGLLSTADTLEEYGTRLYGTDKDGKVCWVRMPFFKNI
ncbi:hypothetical protein [Brazilian marseillevirus]|uniref:hypothetical protein n=1 Tax=Brazilian marseillevirus TaxID=1813599 RepID=UPI0007810281|nr:hypothetical protein A3303_gp229 [Brazilian marseillevirus]AMQ10737.1 hypothetical protein [Brazilian marseillevirus]